MHLTLGQFCEAQKFVEADIQTRKSAIKSEWLDKLQDLITLSKSLCETLSSNHWGISDAIDGSLSESNKPVVERIYQNFTSLTDRFEALHTLAKKKHGLLLEVELDKILFRGSLSAQLPNPRFWWDDLRPHNTCRAQGKSPTEILQEMKTICQNLLEDIQESNRPLSTRFEMTDQQRKVLNLYCTRISERFGIRTSHPFSAVNLYYVGDIAELLANNRDRLLVILNHEPRKIADLELLMIDLFKFEFKDSAVELAKDPNIRNVFKAVRQLLD